MKQLLIFPILLFLVACKKETLTFPTPESDEKTNLTGDTAIFIGVWDWLYTEHKYGWCEGENYLENLSPLTEAQNFSIQFYENGVMFYYKNDSLIAEHRVTFDYFDINSSSCFIADAKQFNLKVDGNPNLNFSGCVSQDTLKCAFPGFIFRSEPGCESYANYFIKQ